MLTLKNMQRKFTKGEYKKKKKKKNGIFQGEKEIFMNLKD